MLSLPSFASASLPPVKALAVQTAMVGGGCGFSLYFPKPDNYDSGFLVSLSSQKGYFVRPEGFYYPSPIESMPLGSERLEAFLAFQTELNAFLFPFFVEAFPLAESLGLRFLSSCLSYEKRYESRKTWLSLPNRKAAERQA